jgi:hypothetical protein
MPVADQWKLRERASVASSPTSAAPSSLSGSPSPTSGSSVTDRFGAADGRQQQSRSAADKTSPASEQPQGDGANAPVQSPGVRTTKNLAGFWSAQNDEVKTRKTRLVQVDSQDSGSASVVYETGARSPTSPVATGAGPTVIENVPRRQDDNVVRAEDPGEWQKPIEIEAGRIRNFANVFQQKQQPQQPERRQVQGCSMDVFSLCAV